MRKRKQGYVDFDRVCCYCCAFLLAPAGAAMGDAAIPPARHRTANP
jgi:hypothetical protein